MHCGLGSGVLTASLFPFDRATAYGNGLVQGCLHWPPTRPPAVYDGTPSAELVIVPRAGHSVQTRAHNPALRRILIRFLAGRQ